MQIMEISGAAAVPQTAGVRNTGTGFADVLKQAEVQSPKSMDDIFKRAAGAYGVPVSLLKAVAKVESNFKPEVTSKCGAMGVMQLMPKTAKALGVADAYDAEENIMGGAKYLSQLLKKYNGDLELTLGAYNAGGGNVKKYGGVPPFSQKYVSKVLGYMGQNLGEIGAVPARSGASADLLTELNVEDVSSLDGLFEALISRNEFTMPQEAEQLYQVIRPMMEFQLNYHWRDFEWEEEKNDGLPLSQQMRWIAL